MRRIACIVATTAISLALAGAAAAAGHGHGGGAGEGGASGEIGGGPGRGGVSGQLGGGLGPGMSPNAIGGGAPGLGPSIRSTARQNSQGDAHAAEIAHDRANSNSALTTSGTGSTDADAVALPDKPATTKAKTASSSKPTTVRQRRMRRHGPAHAAAQGVAEANPKAGL